MLPNSTVPLKVAGGHNFSQVVAGWDTTFGIVGEVGVRTPGAQPGPVTGSTVDAGSFAVGAIVGSVAAGEVLRMMVGMVWRVREGKQWLPVTALVAVCSCCGTCPGGNFHLAPAKEKAQGYTD